MSNQLLMRRRTMLGQSKEVAIHGIPPISITGKINLLSVKAFGECVQNGTPTPDNPVDIVSNNGVIKWDSVNQTIYADGIVETINVYGKNLFNKNMPGVLITGFPINTGAFSPTSGFETVIYPLQIGKTYTITRATSIPTTAAMRVVAYNTQQPQSTDNGVMLYVGTVSSKTATITVPEGYPYVATYVKHTNDVISNAELLDGFQIELGSTATAYAPYYDGGTAIAEMLLKVGNHQDVQSIIDGVVTRNVGVKVLDGTENWEPQAGSRTWGYCYSLTTPLQNTMTGIAANCYSTHFNAVSRCWDTATEPCFSFHNSTASTWTGRPFFVVEQDTAQKFNQWLADQYAAGTPVIVIYPLATPTTEQVVGQTLVLTSGTNIIDITQASLQGLELEVMAK